MALARLRRTITPIDAALAIVLAQDRAAIERVVAHLIDHLDGIDGDADDEPENDAEAVDEREPEDG